MRIAHTLSRIVLYFYRRHKELLDREFWKAILRVINSRYNHWDRVSNRQFINNLGIIEQKLGDLHIELTNSCSASCIYCAYQHQARPNTFMSDDIYMRSLSNYCAMGGGDLMLEVVVGGLDGDPKNIR
ncbi:MAG: hypothetical protein GY931_03305 [Maribacter sp.]|nr:hypothetical protein [Maribacter sp.]